MNGWVGETQKAMDLPEPRLNPGEVLDLGPSLICLCGKALSLHRIDTKKAAREDGSCEGFVLNIVRWKVTRWVDVMNA